MHAADVQRQADFMHWLSQTVLASLYPGGPYERKYLAMLLLNTLLEVWNAPDGGSKAYTRPSSTSQGDAGLACNAGTLVIGNHQFQAFCDGFFDAQTIHLLLGMNCLCRCCLPSCCLRSCCLRYCCLLSCCLPSRHGISKR